MSEPTRAIGFNRDAVDVTEIAEQASHEVDQWNQIENRLLALITPHLDRETMAEICLRKEARAMVDAAANMRIIPQLEAMVAMMEAARGTQSGSGQ